MKKILNRIKDFINRHKIRIQIERCWKEKEPTKPDYNVRNINWYQTIIPNVSVPYYYSRDIKKPLEPYIEYSGVSEGLILTNDYMKTKN